jgi:hypothetical protein
MLNRLSKDIEAPPTIVPDGHAASFDVLRSCATAEVVLENPVACLPLSQQTIVR